MQQRSIFAGIDADGAVRLVGDVPQGAACGCRCAACGSPLVAKKGDVKVWHFAHEASQERPDCYAGAVNLLRTLVIEQLHERLARPLPIYRADVRLPLPYPAHHQRIEWEPGTATSVEWPTLVTQDGPVALLTLAGGTRVFVFVTIDGEGDPQTVERRDGALQLDVRLPLEATQLRDLAQAKRYIDAAGRWAWLALPDADDIKAKTLQAMKAAVRAQREAGAQRMEALRQQHQARERATPRPQQAAPVAAPAAPAPPIDESPWATWRRPSSSIIFYQLKDGSRWAMLGHKDGRSVLLPWPPVEDGWDKALPLRIGVPDLDLGGLVLHDSTEAMIYLSRNSQATRNSSNWGELVAAVQGLSAGKAAG